MFDTTPRMSVEPNNDGSYTYEWLCHDCRWRSGDHFITGEFALMNFPKHVCEETR